MLYLMMHLGYSGRMPTTKIRKTVPLDPEDIARVNSFDADELLHAVAARHAGVDTISSEATLMHTLLIAGLDALEQEADEERYAHYAASEDDEDRSFHAAMRQRNTTNVQLVELDPRRRTTVRAGHHSKYLVHEEPDGTLIWRPAAVVTEDERALFAAPWLVEQIQENQRARTERALPNQ